MSRYFRNSFLFIFITVKFAETESKITCLLNLGSRPSDLLSGSTSDLGRDSPDVKEDNRLWYQKFFADVYTPLICHPVSQIIALISFIAYVIISYYGIQNMVVGFDVSSQN